MRRALVLMVPLALALLAGAARAADPPKVGDKVWAQWRPNAWYHGRIDKKSAVGFHVAYDDGDQGDYPAAMLTVDKAPAEDDVKPGTYVLALWSDGHFYPGHVVRAADGKYDIQYDDGDKGTVGLEDLRLIAVRAAAGKKAKVGDKVWAQWKPNAWYHGEVAKIDPAGLHIAFDDGDKARVAPALVAIDVTPKSVKAGARVLALWSDGHYYPGVVTGETDGKYSIQFDDGDQGTAALDGLRLLDE